MDFTLAGVAVPSADRFQGDLLRVGAGFLRLDQEVIAAGLVVTIDDVETQHAGARSVERLERAVDDERRSLRTRVRVDTEIGELGIAVIVD